MPARPKRPQDYDLERFFSLAVDLLCIAGTDGYFKRVNPAFERTLGFTAEELCARPFVEFIHPDDRAETLAEVVKLSSGAPTLSFENRYRCKDGSYRDLHWTSYPDATSGLLYAVARDVTEWRRLHHRVDGLTRVANRAAFDEALVGEWNRAARFRAPLTAALVDVDRLKGYNDDYGYPAGDECLKRVAQVLVRRARRAGDVVGRYRGGAFALVLTGLADETAAHRLGEQLRQDVEDLDIPFLSAEHNGGRVTVSVGAAMQIPVKTVAPDAILAAADRALAAAKEEGGNRVHGTAE